MKTHLFWLVTLLAVQSLADIANKEAERRREMDRQGVPAKVIEGDPARLAPSGNVSTSAQSPRLSKGGADGEKPGRNSARSYRTVLQKLDREILSLQDRLVMLRERIQAGRWALPKSGKPASSSSASASQERLEWQARDMELKLKRLRQERITIYDEGKRAGFQPGELDGKGRNP